jgi:membrane-bound lytic murein transglycosylase B
MRFRSPALDLTLVAVAAVLAFGSGGCRGGHSEHVGSAASSASWLNARVPRSPGPLADRLVATDGGLRRAIDEWRRDGGPGRGGPPAELTKRARYLHRATDLLSRRPILANATAERLPSRLAHEARELAAALDDLRRLSAGWPPHHVRTGTPRPIAQLLDYYRAGDRRFGVDWTVLAAVNLVESAFGRVRTNSVAGAQGPMQFMPSSWRVYGMGGDIHDPHDAILAAANLLHQAGAPASYGRALYAYNPSRLYVDAVRRYARLIATDPDAIYYLYSW